MMTHFLLKMQLSFVDSWDIQHSVRKILYVHAKIECKIYSTQNLLSSLALALAKGLVKLDLQTCLVLAVKTMYSSVAIQPTLPRAHMLMMLASDAQKSDLVKMQDTTHVAFLPV